LVVEGTGRKMRCNMCIRCDARTVFGKIDAHHVPYSKSPRISVPPPTGRSLALKNRFRKTLLQSLPELFLNAEILGQHRTSNLALAIFEN